MVRRTAIKAVLLAVALTAPAACSPGPADRATAGATVPTEPPRTTTTTTNPYAVPAVIDIAYVNRVLAGLDAAMGDVTRMVIRTKTIPREAYDRLAALYSDQTFLQIQIDNFQSDLRRNFAGYRPEPGNKRTVVRSLITARSSCVFAQVERDYSAVSMTANSPFTTLWVAIRPADRMRDPMQYNETYWTYVYDGFLPDRSRPPDPCAAS